MTSSTWTTGQIDRLGESLKSRKFSPELLVELDKYRSSFIPAYETVVSRLRGPLGYSVTGRPAKSTTALVDKLERQHARLSQVQDISGCRVVVEDIFVQEIALESLVVFLGTPRVVDRRNNPVNSYRAIHLIARMDGRAVEVQLRTELQHLWAEISEKMSDLTSPELKYGVGDPDALLLLRNLSQAVAGVEAEEAARRDFMRQLQARGQRVDKRAKKEIRRVEKRFFERRSRLMQLLRDVHNDFSQQLAA